MPSEHGEKSLQGPSILLLESKAHDSSDKKSVRSTRAGNLKKRRTKPLYTSKIKKHYFTDGANVTNRTKRALHKEKSPFIYPDDLEEFAYKVMTKAWRNDIKIKELKAKCAVKPSYVTRQKKDMLNRLYVKEAGVSSLKTVLEIDPNYYKIVEGRPIPEPLDIRDYVQTLRDCLKTKIITGYREDDIMLIEENLLLEQKMIDEISKNYQTYVNAFEDFLCQDHTESMRLLKESEQEADLAHQKYLEYNELAKEYGALRSTVYKLEEKWRNCKMYQKFLHLVSPMAWQQENDKYNADKISGDLDMNDIFGKYHLSFAEKGSSLYDLVGQFIEDCKTECQPTLYFEEPEQLMEIFKFIEMQNLNSLLHSEELALPIMIVREGMKSAEKSFNMEIKNLQEAIDKLEGGISWEEDRAKYLEELSHKLINDEFKNLIVDEKALNLHVFVEDVYETRVGSNDANLNISEMMKAIEAKYREELLKLDKLPKEQVSDLEGNYYQEQLQIMKYAEKAAKQYIELERITHKLNRALEPPYVKTGKELKKRSPPINPPKPVPVTLRNLTEGETEYLDFFTDYCEHSDELINYGIDIRAEEKQVFVENVKDVKKTDDLDGALNHDIEVTTITNV